MTVWTVYARRTIVNKEGKQSVKHIEPNVIAPTKALAMEQIRHFLSDSTSYRWRVIDATEGAVK